MADRAKVYFFPKITKFLLMSKRQHPKCHATLYVGMDGYREPVFFLDWYVIGSIPDYR